MLPRSRTVPTKPLSAAPTKQPSAKRAPAEFLPLEKPPLTFTKLVLSGSRDDVTQDMRNIINDPLSGFVMLYQTKPHEISEDFCAKDVCGPGGQRTIQIERRPLVVLTMERMHHDLFDIISRRVQDKAKLQSVIDNRVRLIAEVGGFLKHLAERHGYIYSDIKPENVGVDFDEKGSLTRIKLLDYGSQGAWTVQPTPQIGREGRGNIFVIAAFNFLAYVSFVYVCKDYGMLSELQSIRFAWVPTNKTNSDPGKMLMAERKLTQLKERYDEFRILSEGTPDPQGVETSRPLDTATNYEQYAIFIQDAINIFKPHLKSDSVKHTLSYPATP